MNAHLSQTHILWSCE